jgi:hypothetical protein
MKGRKGQGGKSMAPHKNLKRQKKKKRSLNVELNREKSTWKEKQ